MHSSKTHHIRPFAWLFAAFAVLLTPSYSQSVGGEFEKIFQWDSVYSAEQFGSSVSGAGDVNADGFDDVIVGAYTASQGPMSRGFAYVYSGQNGTLLFEWGGNYNFDHLGWSVSGAGDVNADGFDDLIVGAPDAYLGPLFSPGAAYVYSGQNGALLYQWNGAVDYDKYGSSVSGAGDVNGDGFDDLIVGAYYADSGSLSAAGSAFVYSGQSGALLYQWDGTVAFARLGFSVSGAGDVNADGFDDLIVGAPGAGSTFVYSGQNGALLHQWNGTTIISAGFASSVSGAGDVNADGFDDLIVGAYHGDPGGLPSAGSAFVYSGQSGALLYQWTGTISGQWLGWSVSGAGDVNADGFDDLIVGAPGNRPGGLLWDAGSAYIYSGQNGALLHQQDGEAPFNDLGFSVSGAGDVNADGFDDLIVGAPGRNSASGSAYVFGFNPFMSSNVSTISVVSTSSLDFQLHFPVEAAGYPYKVLFSPTGPGLAHYGVDIPLPNNGYSRGSFFGNYPFTQTSNLHGTLDANGDASAAILFPAGAYSSYVGLTMTFAAIAIEPGLLPSHSSIAVPVTLVP